MREAAQRLRRGVALPDEIDMAEADVDRLALRRSWSRCRAARRSACRSRSSAGTGGRALHICARNIRTCARGRRRIARIRRADWALASHRRLCRRPARTDRRSRSRTPRSASSRKACATSAGTCAFIAQVSDRSPSAPNLRPAMKTMFCTFGSRLMAASSSRSQAMVSMPRASSHAFDAGVAEARDADDAAAGQGGLCEARQRRSHLAGDAEDHDVAVDFLRSSISAWLGRHSSSSSAAMSESSSAKCRASAACFCP